MEPATAALPDSPESVRLSALLVTSSRGASIGGRPKSSRTHCNALRWLSRVQPYRQSTGLTNHNHIAQICHKTKSGGAKLSQCRNDTGKAVAGAHLRGRCPRSSLSASTLRVSASSRAHPASTHLISSDLGGAGGDLEGCVSFRRRAPHFGGVRLISSYLRGHALHCRHVVDDSDGSTRYIPFLSPSGWSGAGATAAR